MWYYAQWKLTLSGRFTAGLWCIGLPTGNGNGTLVYYSLLPLAKRAEKPKKRWKCATVQPSSHIYISNRLTIHFAMYRISIQQQCFPPKSDAFNHWCMFFDPCCFPMNHYTIEKSMRWIPCSVNGSKKFWCKSNTHNFHSINNLTHLNFDLVTETQSQGKETKSWCFT